MAINIFGETIRPGDGRTKSPVICSKYGDSSGVLLRNDEKENNCYSAGTGGSIAWALMERV